MSGPCRNCSSRKTDITRSHGQFVHAAKRAAGRPTAPNIAAMEKARQLRDEARDLYARHLDDHVDTTGGAA